jgi:hypothetical protein
MKELGITLKKFASGLRMESSMPRNSDTLTTCINLAPREVGLLPLPSISQPITSISTSFPYPQIFLGSFHWILLTKDKLYSINADWSVTLELDLSVYYGGHPTASYGIWHIADFHEYLIATNGQVTILYHPGNAQWEYNDGTNIPTLGSVLNFNGQIIGTGVETLAGDSKTTFHDTDSNFLMWGGIGSATFAIDQSNTRGYRPMKWPGSIHKITKLGENIMVYGSNGIAVCSFNEVSLGMRMFRDYGIPGRGAVFGDEKTNCFVDNQGYLNVIDSGLETVVRGYQEFISTLSGDIVVTQSPDESDYDYYITDGSTAYLKTPEGLTECTDAPTTLQLYNGSTIGFADDLLLDRGEIVTDILDFADRGMKTLDVIEIGGSSSEEIYVAVSWRVAKDSAFRITSWKRLNSQGTVVFPISGVEFKIHVKSDAYDDFDLDYITLRVKFDDKRAIRGTRASTTIT